MCEVKGELCVVQGEFVRKVGRVREALPIEQRWQTSLDCLRILEWCTPHIQVELSSY